MSTKQKRVQTGLLYIAGGDVYRVRPADGKKFDYKELQSAVEGYIETVVAKTPRHTAFANEEGLIHRLPRNVHTDKVVDVSVYHRNGYSPNWLISGNIIEYWTAPASQDNTSDTYTIATALHAAKYIVERARVLASGDCNDQQLSYLTVLKAKIPALLRTQVDNYIQNNDKKIAEEQNKASWTTEQRRQHIIDKMREE